MKDHKEYPRWKHHAEHGAKLCHDHKAEKALGEGWHDDIPKKEEAKSEKPVAHKHESKSHEEAAE